jgi:hypothetical protein
MNWKDVDGNVHGLILRNYVSIFMEELRKIIKSLGHGNWFRQSVTYDIIYWYYRALELG